MLLFRRKENMVMLSLSELNLTTSWTLTAFNPPKRNI